MLEGGPLPFCKRGGGGGSGRSKEGTPHPIFFGEGWGQGAGFSENLPLLSRTFPEIFGKGRRIQDEVIWLPHKPARKGMGPTGFEPVTSAV